jgi:hypothetical protein
MVYDPGALNASLAAAVGSDGESALRQADLMSRSRCDANWHLAASRLQSLAASFGAVNLQSLAQDAIEGAPGDPAVQRRITAAIDDFATR